MPNKVVYRRSIVRIGLTTLASTFGERVSYKRVVWNQHMPDLFERVRPERRKICSLWDDVENKLHTLEDLWDKSVSSRTGVFRVGQEAYSRLERATRERFQGKKAKNSLQTSSTWLRSGPKNSTGTSGK